MLWNAVFETGESQMRNHRQPTLFLSSSLLLFLLLWTVVWRLDLKLLHNRTGRWCEKCEKNPCQKTWYCVLLRAHDVETLIIRSKFMSAQGNRLNKNKLSASQKLLLCFIKCFACSLPWGTFTLLLFVLFLLLSMIFSFHVVALLLLFLLHPRSVLRF